MKKHSGKVIYFGIMVGLFGLLIMGAVSAATGFIMGGAYQAISGLVQTASDLSLALVVLGALFLGMGLYMRTGMD